MSSCQRESIRFLCVVVVVILSSALSSRGASVHAQASSGCGAWLSDLELKLGESKPTSLDVAANSADTAHGCPAQVTVTNTTPLIFFGAGYTIEVQFDKSADIKEDIKGEFEKARFLTSLFPWKPTLSVTDTNSVASLRFTTAQTAGAFAVDAVRFIVRSTVALVDPPCVVDPEQLFVVATNLRALEEQAGSYAIAGQWKATLTSLQMTMPDVWRAVQASAIAAGQNCIFKALTKALKATNLVVGIAADAVTWLLPWWLDYNAHGRRPIGTTVTYAPTRGTTNVNVPGVTGVQGGSSGGAATAQQFPAIQSNPPTISNPPRPATASPSPSPSPTPVPAIKPSGTLSPSSGPPGTTVQVSGKGWEYVASSPRPNASGYVIPLAALNELGILWDGGATGGSTAATANVQPSGDLTGSFVVPANAQPGMHAVSFLPFRTPTGIAPVMFTVTGSSPPSSSGISVGTTVEVTGTGDCLNIRSVPSTSADRVACLKDGTTAIVRDGPRTGDGHTWWLLDAGGWAAQEYLRVAGSSQPASAAFQLIGPDGHRYAAGQELIIGPSTIESSCTFYLCKTTLRFTGPQSSSSDIHVRVNPTPEDATGGGYDVTYVNGTGSIAPRTAWGHANRQQDSRGCYYRFTIDINGAQFFVKFYGACGY